MLSLNQANIAVILLSVTITLLFLKNRQIPLYQFSNFVLSPSNHPGSGTMLFGITVCAILWYSVSTVNISLDVSNVASSVVLFLFNAFSLVILNNPSISSSTSIVSGLYLAVLSIHGLYHNYLYLVSGLSYLGSSTTILSYIFLIVSTV